MHLVVVIMYYRMTTVTDRIGAFFVLFGSFDTAFHSCSFHVISYVFLFLLLLLLLSVCMTTLCNHLFCDAFPA